MATRHRIDEALHSENMGDVEKYFNYLTTMIEKNSGVNDFKLITSDCYNVNAPFKENQFATFNLTDESVDIVDISKGFINLKCDIDLQFLYENLDPTFVTESSTHEFVYFFVGFKSASHLLHNYNVYSNGRLTECKSTTAKHEQAIVYSAKAKEEKCGRPGMYSPHKEVLKMSKCVAGTYIKLPVYADKDKQMKITLDLMIQVDDILPFSGMTYLPTFLTKDMKIQISTSLHQSMVFCQIPLNSVVENLSETFDITDPHSAIINAIIHPQSVIDSRFTQCGDYADCLIGYCKEGQASTFTLNPIKTTILPTNITIVEAKSYVYGFNIKESAKQNILRVFQQNNFIIPSQSIEWHQLSQLPTINQIRSTIQVPMFNASQIIFTFPNSANKLTVMKNPHLESVQCHIADRIIPDKFFTTLDNSHAEMIIANLNMDSLFSAPHELIEALTKNRKQCGSWTLRKHDDGDYMLVFNLERFGNGCFCDGLSGNNIPIALNANFMEGTNNPHYYEMVNGVKQHKVQNINLYIVQDTFWIFGPDGAHYIKDSSSLV